MWERPNVTLAFELTSVHKRKKFAVGNWENERHVNIEIGKLKNRDKKRALFEGYFGVENV